MEKHEPVIGIGLVGAGGIGAVHRQVYERLPGVRVVAIADPRGERVYEDGKADYIQSTGSADARVPVHGTMEELLAHHEVDVVDICAPTPLHRELVIRALEAGYHVLCEKPMGRTLDDCREVLEAARRARGRLMIAHCLRFWPAYEYLGQAVRQGLYGAVLRARFERQAVVPPGSHFLLSPASGGAMLDLHIHDVDMALSLWGPPNAVAVDGELNPVTRCHDFVSAQWHYGDRLVQLEARYPRVAEHGFRMQFWVDFEQARLSMDSAREPELLLHRRGCPDEAVPLPKEDGYSREIAYFLNVIRSGKTPDRCPPEASMLALAMIERELQSITTRRPQSTRDVAASYTLQGVS